MERLQKENIKAWLPLREPDAHKGDFGRVLIAAGSKGMMGACILSCRAAFRSGSGLVAACCDPDLFSDVHAGVPEATCVAREDVSWDRYDAAGAGPGLGVTRTAYDFLLEAMTRFSGPLVLDADALNCLAAFGIPDPKTVRASLIITPHAGEAAKLLNAMCMKGIGTVSPEDISKDRERFGLLLSQRLGAVTVMKGAESLIILPDGRVYQNTTGNPGMATGGSGDVLTGMTVSLAGQLAAQGKNPEEAAVLGTLCSVYLHGLAGDMAAESWGQAGVMASDLADYAALALRSFDPISFAERIDKK